jgi:choline-sulfatase
MTNTLLLMSDEHNPFYSSVYGHPTLQTPHMAALARQGTVYRSAYCPSPLCAPTRSAFMAGKRIHQLQTYSNSAVNINPNHRTYGAVLDAAGVHVAHIGKTDVYDRPENLGFTEMILPKDTHWPEKELGRDPLMSIPESDQRGDEYGPHPAPWDLDQQRVQAALTWLETVAPRLDKPWVLVVQLFKPHFAHYTTQRLWDLYPNGGDLPTYGPDQPSAQHPYAQDLRKYFRTDAFTEAQIRGLRRGYLGCVTFVDEQLGRLVDALDQTGQRDDTNVIYTSDHGEMLGKFGMWWKSSLYEDSVRVPLIAAGPDFPVGQEVQTPVDLLDLQASLFASAGVERPADWVGEPLQGLPANDPDRVVFSEYHGHGTRASAYMVRRGPWKYIHYIAGPDQLFHLEADPQELDNQIDARAEIASELEAALRQICSPEHEQDRAGAFIQGQLATLATR